MLLNSAPAALPAYPVDKNLPANGGDAGSSGPGKISCQGAPALLTSQERPPVNESIACCPQLGKELVHSKTQHSQKNGKL